MLPRKERLTRSADIGRVLRLKQYEVKGPLLCIAARDNGLAHSRLVVVTPKKLGKAVDRNRLRRLICSAYAKIKHKIAKNVDVVVRPGNRLVGLQLDAVIKPLVGGLKKICII